MTAKPLTKSDFFLSRRGSVAAIAREVADTLTEKGYKVFVQDYDIPLGASFINEMHEGIKNSRDLIILFTHDYEQSPYTRKEFTSFVAEQARSTEERYIIILRCEDVPLRGLLADNVYQDLVGIDDPAERKARIIAAVERQSQATPPPLRPFVDVPPRIVSFTGRSDELDKLDAILLRDKPAAVTQTIGRAAVRGLGGVGKTSLVVEYAHRFRNLYAGIWWCPAETRAGLLSSLSRLAVSLGVTTPEEADVEKAAKAALRRLAEQRARWLLVYDNVTSPDEIADLLPSAGARVLITSRFSDWADWAEEVALDVLPLEEAIAFLRNRAERSNETEARTLAEALGRLPLALDHAAAMCRRTQMSFADYAAKVESLIAAAPRGLAYPRSVAATFDLAITEAVAQCPAAEALMAFLATCAPERIPMSFIEGAIDDEVGRLAALGALAELSLAKHDPFEDGTAAVTVHRLVQAVARVRSVARGTAQIADERLIAGLSALYPQHGYSDPQCWPQCAQLTAHLLARRIANPAGRVTEWPDLLNRAGGYFLGRASYGQAVSLLRDALAIREKVLGPEHSDTATSLHNLAFALQEQGDLAKARPLHERALAIRENVLPPAHPDLAESLNSLAFLIQAQGHLSMAHSLFGRALKIREKAFGPEDAETAQSLNNLANLLRNQGELEGARSLFERALAIREKTLGPAHPLTALSLNSFAILLHDLGDHLRARSLCERALAIREKVLGPEHPRTATSLDTLANLRRKQGDLEDARPLLERALAIREKTLGPTHPETVRTRNELAILRSEGE